MYRYTYTYTCVQDSKGRAYNTRKDILWSSKGRVYNAWEDILWNLNSNGQIHIPDTVHNSK